MTHGLPQLDLFSPPPTTGGPDGVPNDVAALFDHLAVQIKARGFTRYSADAILHRIRWHYQIERGQRAFKCNDHWTAPLSRWCMRKHPELKRFFETRERRAAPVVIEGAAF